MNCKEQRNRLFAGILSVLMVVALCATLAMPARATEGEITDPAEGTTVMDQQAAIITDGVPAEVQNIVTESQEASEEADEETDEVTEEAAEEETEPTEPQPEVDPVVIWEAKENLLALLPEQVKIDQAAILDAPEWALELCREDVLAALELNTQAILLEKELEAANAQILDKIAVQDHLTQEDKDAYLLLLEEEKPVPYSSEELFAGLWSWAEADIPMEQTELWMETVREQMKKIHRMSVQMDNLKLLLACDEKIAQVNECLALEADVQTVEYAAINRYNALIQRADSLRKEVEDCLDMDEAELEALTARVEELKLDVEQFAIGVTVDNTEAMYALQLKLEKKMILVYVAMGIGAVGVLIAVIAVVLVVIKNSQKQELDVSALASREAAEQLDAQNRNLKREIAQLNDKLDAQYKAQNEAIARLQREMTARPVVEVPKAEPEKPVIAPATPADTARKIGYLRLEYNAIAPSNAYLQKCEQCTDYILYSDSTVEFVADANAMKYKNLSGWITSGLLYLYNPVLDGQEVPTDNSSQYSGYFQPKNTLRRAKIKQLNGGNYVLEEKGAVSMEKA